MENPGVGSHARIEMVLVIPGDEIAWQANEFEAKNLRRAKATALLQSLVNAVDEKLRAYIEDFKIGAGATITCKIICSEWKLPMDQDVEVLRASCLITAPGIYEWSRKQPDHEPWTPPTDDEEGR